MISALALAASTSEPSKLSALPMEVLVQKARIEAELKRHRIEKFLRENDPLDEDGYPTEKALAIVRDWPWNDPKNWLAFIESMWHLHDWGWHTTHEAHEKTNASVVRHSISTAGWSGNESLIRAMQENFLLWDDCWVQSRRGGHHVFELRAEEEAESDVDVPARD